MSAEPVERVSDSLAGLLVGWLPQQRWFSAKGVGAVTAQRLGGLAPSDPAGEVDLEVHFLAVTVGIGPTTVYQVPLSYRDAPEPALENALVGVLRSRGRRRWVYDAVHEPAFVRAWLRLLTDGAQVTDADGAAGGAARGVRQPAGWTLDPDAPTKVLAGEQSNTSVVVGADGPTPAIVKLFRVLAPGDNPDVIVQSALAAAGCERVPRPVGWVEGTWPAPAGEGNGRPVRGHLAFAAEFLAGSEDAWRVACRSVEGGERFEEQAHALGAATAEVHLALAATFPTTPATQGLLDDLADNLRGRVTWAVAEAPALAEREAAALLAVEAVRTATDAGPLVLQQVHGDYHLGQVLHSPTRGWVLLDFEGEPLRPLAERLAPDLALRDVAGMLRSFDYAARHATVALPDADPRVAAADAWAAACRTAFLAGYAEVTGRDPAADGALLRALELDKALYEVVYETRNRPTWLAVPLHAVRRLLPLDSV
ncbi:MAG: maltokinase N-terminal cap-like domain-containing protein [Kineosporiaceae bacterium]